MPKPLPSDVGGSDPIDKAATSDDRRRVKELSEVLLTTRAKMVGTAKFLAPALEAVANSRSPNEASLARSSVVNAFGEIIALLDSYNIRPGDTALTGHARLGADDGMKVHFDRGQRERLLGGAEPGWMREPTLEAPAHRGSLSAPVAGLLETTAEEVDEHEVEGRLDRMGLGTNRYGEHERERRERIEREARETRVIRANLTPPSIRGPRGLDVVRDRSHTPELTSAQFEMLRYVCLGVLFEMEPERPPGLYADRRRLLDELQSLKLVGLVGRGRWLPTVEGFERSGLIGDGRLEVDP